MDESLKGYQSFGEFNFYKQHILQYLFNIAEEFGKLDQKLPLRFADRQKDIITRKDFLRDFNSFVMLLLPKIKKLEEEQDIKEYGELNNLRKEDLDILAEDYNKMQHYYYLAISLIERLGYSDMSLKKDEDHVIEW